MAVAQFDWKKLVPINRSDKRPGTWLTRIWDQGFKRWLTAK
jgi:hypothetical protein